MKYFSLSICISFCLMVASCQKKQEAPADSQTVSKDSLTQTKKFDMYQLSEMAMLMEQMYVDNQRLRDRIINGDTLGTFPKYFEKINFAVMTDDSDMDAFFKEHAQEFLKAQKLVYDNPDDAKTYFNQAVQSCVTCHEVKCGGPIPKIKKLYIPN